MIPQLLARIISSPEFSFYNSPTLESALYDLLVAHGVAKIDVFWLP